MRRAAIASGDRPKSPRRTISPWLIGDAAEHLRQIFGEADAGQEFLDLAIGALGGQALGVVREFAQALDISREPGEAVGGVLFRLDQLRESLPSVDTRARMAASASL